MKNGVAQAVEVRVRHEHRTLREKPRQPRSESAHGASAHRPDLLHDFGQHRLFNRLLEIEVIVFIRL